MKYPYRLLAPGPVPVPEKVLRTISDKVLHHRTPEFIEILNRSWRQLSEVFQTQQRVMILTGSGSAAMEASITNTLSPNDEVLVVVSGKFGERWASMCDRFGMKTIRWEIPWGTAMNLERFADQLKRHPQIKAVLTQVCETSTATVHPVREMAVLVREHAPHALFALDAITAIGCMPLPMDDWDIDVIIAGSQKAFMIPAGLSFIALSERAWEAQRQARSHRFYFDLAAERKHNESGDTMFSIPTSLVVGLSVVLEQVHQCGIERLIRRCLTLSEATRSIGEMLGLKTYSASPAPSVTALITPHDSSKIRDWLERERNITIMGGQDQLRGKILRIGHMGDVRNEDMLALFQGLSECLQVQVKGDFKPDLDRQLRLAEPLFS